MWVEGCPGPFSLSSHKSIAVNTMSIGLIPIFYNIINNLVLLSFLHPYNFLIHFKFILNNLLIQLSLCFIN